MYPQEKVVVSYAHRPWTAEFGKALFDAATHWWNVTMPSLGEIPNREAFVFLDRQLSMISPLDLSGWCLTITSPELVDFVFQPDGSFEFVGYDEQAETVGFRWELGTNDRRVMTDWLDFPAAVQASDSDDSVFVLVRLNNERSAPAVILVPDGEFTANAVAPANEMQRLIAAATF